MGTRPGCFPFDFRRTNALDTLQNASRIASTPPSVPRIREGEGPSSARPA
jgi:hypothetical protein